jgi:hypothetical protein
MTSDYMVRTIAALKQMIQRSNKRIDRGDYNGARNLIDATRLEVCAIEVALGHSPRYEVPGITEFHQELKMAERRIPILPIGWL